MITVETVLNYIQTLAPTYMQESWDRVGLNCGRLDRPVTKILVALDPFSHVCQEAKDIGANLLITHHAQIWNAGFVTDQTEQGRNTLFLIENGIACINAHTNLDCAPGGVNDCLAEALGLKDISVIAPRGTDEAGHPWGLLRKGTVTSQPLPAFLRHVKTSLGCEGLRYADGGKPVCRVAVGGGACGDFLEQALDAGCDTFVTADIKYNQFWDAQALGLNLIDAGHFYTENPVCFRLQQRLAAQFPEITVELSKKHRDCAKFFL